MRPDHRPPVRGTPAIVVIAFVALAGAAAIGALAELPAFLRAYLLGWSLWLGVALGAFMFLCVHHLVGGRWGAAIRPPLAAACETLPLLALLFVPIALGVRAIFPWADDAFMQATPLRAAKAAYFDGGLFLARSATALALWSVLGFMLARVRPGRLRPGLAALGLVVYFLTITTASVDWILSLDPDMSTSAFGLDIAMGNAVAGLAVVVLTAAVLAGRGPRAPRLPSDRVHDLGTLLFASVMLWAYVAFSQYLLVWAGDLPRESAWYLARLRGPWLWTGWSLVALHFAAPFLLLLFRPIKRSLPSLAALAAGLVAMHFVELCWLMLPARALVAGAAFHWLDIVVPLALAALWTAVFALRLDAAPALLITEDETEGGSS